MTNKAQIKKEKPKLFVTRSYFDDSINLLNKNYHLIYFNNTKTLPRTKLLIGLKEADAVLSQLEDQLGEKELSRAPQLKVIANYAVGVNNIYLKYCQENSIKVGHTPGVLTEATADLAFALLMSASRRIHQSAKFYKIRPRTLWDPTSFLGIDLRGKTLGIIGPGRIASSFAQTLSNAYQVKLQYFGRSKAKELPLKDSKKLNLKSLFKTSDIISIHCPLNDQSHHLIGKDELSLMKEDAILINTARSEIINERHLYQFLKRRKDVYAGLDVLPHHDQKLLKSIIALDNVTATPHIGSAEKITRHKMFEISINNIDEVFYKKNKPTNYVV